MPKFNKGDKVVRTNGSAFGCKEGDIVTVVSCNDRQLSLEEHIHFTYDPDYFELLVEETLPEVPDSTRYECDMYPGRDFIRLMKKRDSVVIKAEEEHEFSSVVLSVETALAMASDLRRMAMKIKREQEGSE